MADLERQSVVTELRKFRKKLRQIEKLEDLERDLTEEEYFKLSKKDEVRSKVQQLVAREEQLNCELQNMASEQTQDEQTTQPTEQEEETNTQTTEQSQTEETSQEVASENVLNENDLTINEIYDQAPVVTNTNESDVAATKTTVTTEPLMSSLNKTYAKFFVRNLEGHNDVICDVACRGSVLVSGGDGSCRVLQSNEIRLQANSPVMNQDNQGQLTSSSESDQETCDQNQVDAKKNVTTETVDNKIIMQAANSSCTEHNYQEQPTCISPRVSEQGRLKSKKETSQGQQKLQIATCSQNSEMVQCAMNKMVDQGTMTQITSNSTMGGDNPELPALPGKLDQGHNTSVNNEISPWQQHLQIATCSNMDKREGNVIMKIGDNMNDMHIANNTVVDNDDASCQGQLASSSKTIQDRCLCRNKDIIYLHPSSSLSQQDHAEPQNETASRSEGRAVMEDVEIYAVSCCSNMTRSQNKTSLDKIWKCMKFSTRRLEGHYDLICDVDCRGAILVSVGRDTMLKLWDADTGREMRSMGGHTGTITSVFLLPKKDMSACDVPSSFRTDQYSVITGSKDCSMKIWSLANGQIKRSLYAFSPVESIDCNKNLTVAGLDGGKVELWDLETGTTVRSVRGHDEDAVTAVKFQDERVISGSATGVVKVWDIRDNSLKPVMSSDQAPVDQTDAGVTVKPRRVRCLSTTKETVYWGDDGVNIKAMDLSSGKLRKLRNHVTEFGSTGAMETTGSCLVSAGYDLDRGNGYLNVRSLPSEEYLATVDDECTGSITCLSCTQATRDQMSLHRMCTGGLELKLWDQLPSSKVKKRSRPETDDVYVTAKHVRRYTQPEVSDTESSEDEDDQPEGDDSDDDDDVSSVGTTSRSWCVIS